MRIDLAIRRLTNRLFPHGAGGFRVLGLLLWMCVGAVVQAGETDELGRTALWHAARAGDEPLTAQLLAAGADPDAEDRFGVSPLVAAIKRGQLGTTRLLLNAGAAVNPLPRAKFIPLHAAVVEGDVDVIFALLAAGADPLVQQETGDPATDLNRNAMVRTRLRGITRNTFLLLGTGAPARLRFDATEPRASARLEVTDAAGLRVFGRAVGGPIAPPAVEVAWDLRDDAGSEIAPGEYTVTLLFDDGTEATSTRRAIPFERMTLFEAAAYASGPAVKAWVRAGTDVEAVDRYGRTALMYAAAFANEETTAALLAAGASSDREDAGGRTAFDYAELYAPGQRVGKMVPDSRPGLAR